MMGKKKESRSLQMIKKTSNDINQLFNELTTGLSHEYLYTDDRNDDNAIKGALDIINELKENFLKKTKEAMDIILDEEDADAVKEAEEKIEVILEGKKEEEDQNRVPLPKMT